MSLLKDRLARNNAVLVESDVWVRGERYKLDLVVVSNEAGALVLDVTVRYESKKYLAQAADEKINKYNVLLQKINGNSM